jgi:hypothetical protein
MTKRFVERYEYIAANGVLRGRVDRIEPGLDGRAKSFVQYRFDAEKRRFLKRLNGAKLPLYHADLVAPAGCDGRSIFFVEGERKADRLRAALGSAGVAAEVTTIAGGAPESLTAEHLTDLHDARCITVIVDSDVAGREAGRIRGGTLAADNRERTVKVLDLYPHAVEGGDDYKKDVDDWLAEDHAISELMALIEAEEPVAAGQPVREDGAALLADLVAVCRKFLAMPGHYADVMALYVVHTHALGAASLTPYLYFRSPEADCGKTLALTLLKHLCRKSELSVAVTPATLFRFISVEEPTYIIDEIDTIYGRHSSERNEDLRAIINTGFERGATIPRCKPPTFEEVVRFKVFCPKVFGGKYCRMPDTVLSRCIIFEMKRKTAADHVEPYIRDDPEMLAALRALHDRAAAWASQNVGALRSVRPHRPDGLGITRPLDLWMPIFAIAELVDTGATGATAGGWVRNSYKAAKAFAMRRVENEADDSLGVQLLRAVEGAFRPLADEHGMTPWPAADQLFTETLIDRLCKSDGAWATYGRRGDRMTANDLSRVLKQYTTASGARIRSRNIRDAATVRKGYYFSDFADALSRYVHVQTATGATSHTKQGNSAGGEAATEPFAAASGNGEKACQIKDVAVVAPATPESAADTGQFAFDFTGPTQREGNARSCARSRDAERRTPEASSDAPSTPTASPIGEYADDLFTYAQRREANAEATGEVNDEW